MYLDQRKQWYIALPWKSFSLRRSPRHVDCITRGLSFEGGIDLVKCCQTLEVCLSLTIICVWLDTIPIVLGYSRKGFKCLDFGIDKMDYTCISLKYVEEEKHNAHLYRIVIKMISNFKHYQFCNYTILSKYYHRNVIKCCFVIKV